MESPVHQEYATFFRDKAIFLTGATGNLGLCTLYKLVIHLQAKRVYAFVRRSRPHAMTKIRSKMPDHANLILNSNKVSYVVGDMRLPGLGINEKELRCLEDEVNIIIHTAAVLSLLDPIDECIKNNCNPVLELAQMATNFKTMQRLVFVSSVYVNSFLPDGTVKEKIYPLMDAEDEEVDPEIAYEEIIRTGCYPLTKQFAWPYALSKYLAERLLVARYSSIPLLIARSSTIGPTFETPFPLFGDEQSFPFQHAAKIYLRDPQASKVWHAPPNSSSGTNILDEIPVDYVSNVILLHIAAGNQGVVHASAGNYVQQTVDDGLMSVIQGDEAQEKLGFRWIAADAGPQCALANLFAIGNRDWNFGCSKSAVFHGMEGPLSVGATLEQVRTYNNRRYVALRGELRAECST